MQHVVAHATLGCRLRNMVSHMQHNVAYATSECCIRNIVSRMQHIFKKKNDFSQKEPDEIFFIDKTLIHARLDYTKLKRNLK